jgi:type I restriction enzyme M protein
MIPERAREAVPVPDGELHAEFLSRLHELGGKAGNGGLREALGWDEATYDTVKAELVSGNKVLLGRGRGGSVALTQDGT